MKQWNQARREMLVQFAKQYESLERKNASLQQWIQLKLSCGNTEAEKYTAWLLENRELWQQGGAK